MTSNSPKCPSSTRTHPKCIIHGTKKSENKTSPSSEYLSRNGFSQKLKREILLHADSTQRLSWRQRLAVRNKNRDGKISHYLWVWKHKKNQI